MKKNFLFLGVAAGAVILGLACYGYLLGKGSQKTIPDFVLTYAENQSEDYPTTRGAYKFRNLVYDRTGGKVEILISANGILGDEKAVIEQLQFGAVDFARVSLSPLAEVVPKLNVLQMPYLYVSREHMWKVLDGPLGEDFMESLDSAALLPLSWYDAGARSFYNSLGPVRQPEDLKGMKIRVQESELSMDMVEAMGAVPVPMAYGNVYSGLQTGKINGAENNWPSYKSTRHYEVAKYFTRDEHTRVPELQMISKSTWEKLPEEYRFVIRQCARESALYERELWENQEKLAEERVRKAGCQVTELSPEERARFQEAAAPLYEKYCADYMDIIDEIEKEGR